MKVLYISGMYPTPTYPQKGIFCHEQVKAMKQIGLEVDVVVPMTVYDREYPGESWNYEGVEIKYLRYFKIPGTIGYQHLGRSLYIRLLKSGIDFSKYDILHADAPLPTGDAIRRLSKRYKVPFVEHGHGLDVFLEESYRNARNCAKISKASEKVYDEADAVIGVSQKVLNKIQEKLNIGKKAYVVYNGVDTDRFQPVTHHNEEFTVVSIGNLIPLKGFDYTIKAIKLLIEQGYTNVKLRIAGRGELDAELKQLTKRLQMERYVEFLGYIPYDEIIKLLQQSDVFLLPSWYEALGCVYLEAMACGIPAIGCMGNGIDEVITDGVDGYLVEEKNEKQIAEKLVDLIANNRYVELGQNARACVTAKYKWLHSALALKKIYEELKNDSSGDET